VLSKTRELHAHSGEAANHTMSIGILIAFAGLALLMWAAGKSSPSGAIRVDSDARPTAIDEAERILTARYAAGAISPREYREALTLLRT